MMSQLIGDIITRDSAVELSGRMQRNIYTGKSMKEKLSKYKALTFGIIASLKCYSLGYDVAEHVMQEEKVKLETTKTQAKTRHKTKSVRKSKAGDLHSKNFVDLTSDEVMFLIRYKSKPTDVKLENIQKNTRVRRYNETFRRNSPTISPYTSEIEEEKIDGDEHKQGEDDKSNKRA